jgi:hypothetical protein
LVYKIVIGAGKVQAQRSRYIWTTRGSDDGIVYEMLIEAVEKKGGRQKYTLLIKPDC